LAFFLRSSHTKVKNSKFYIIKDRNQSGFHRFEPNSRIFLINEQFNLLDQLQSKDKMNRHRGHKLKSRFDRSFWIILLSLWYFLSVNRFLIFNQQKRFIKAKVICCLKISFYSQASNFYIKAKMFWLDNTNCTLLLLF